MEEEKMKEDRKGRSGKRGDEEGKEKKRGLGRRVRRSLLLGVFIQ